MAVVQIRNPFQRLDNGDASPLANVLHQEVARYQQLRSVLSSSLADVVLAMQGRIVMSSDLEAMMAFLLRNQVCSSHCTAATVDSIPPQGSHMHVTAGASCCSAFCGCHRHQFLLTKCIPYLTLCASILPVVAGASNLGPVCVPFGGTPSHLDGRVHGTRHFRWLMAHAWCTTGVLAARPVLPTSLPHSSAAAARAMPSNRHRFPLFPEPAHTLD